MIYRGTIIAAASGKLNGKVFAHNAGGPYIRAFTVPTDPATARQVNCREALAACYTWWRTIMSPTERSLWEDYAASQRRTNRIGDARPLSGFSEFTKQAFLKFQINEQLGAALDPGTVPPRFGLPFTEAPSAVLNGSGNLNVSWQSASVWEGDQDNFIAVYASSPREPTINFFKGPYQLRGFIPGDLDEPPTSPVEITLPVAPTAGQKIFYRLRFCGNDRPLSPTWTGMSIYDP